ncbi:putative bifunctional diguanylate cyclase/phosphodiesterase [Specibacter cremeus]|uniref:putative bifunctional diguanylate cyclase/phosphodiesterase n=1 Tax=Specibacter cremeus TaxID=1629051 RepID=UPI000F7AD9A3|nr:EAL domain-containing protein [Specibacter cremeus]
MPASTDALDPRLGRLVEGIVQLAGGDLTTRIEPSPARDDIDAVIIGFNLMAEELRAANAELERRVENRTALLQQAHHQMERMSLTDPLTNVYNRRALVMSLDRAITDAVETAEPPAVLLLDLDSFKGVNDSLGHGAGDLVLKIVAQRILHAVREGDIVARLGGDEFAVLLPATSTAQARVVAARIVESLSQSVTVDDRRFNFGASVGIASPEGTDSAEYLLVKADTAMYAAKRDENSSIMAFDPVLLYARQRRSQLVSELRSAIDAGQLVLHYQPVVELATGRIEGVEALVRWNHPTRGLLMPDDFIPLAEESGSIVDLDGWVLRAGLAQLRQWQTTLELDDRFTLRVNISAAELQRLEFVDDVRAALAAATVDPAHLVLELTESKLVTGTDLEQYSLRGLRNLGVGLDIDDFGTGYSSLAYLRNLPMDVVKVDRSLIGDVATDARQQRFVVALLELIRACGMEAVFEGVETRDQAEMLRSLGCTNGQGFYFGRPVPAGEIEAVLAGAGGHHPVN